MKRTFNFTGRKKILRSDVSITLRQQGNVWLFDADLRLADYGFYANAEVWIEAHRQNLWMQWAWGTVSVFRKPDDRILSEFDVPNGVLFRVRVVRPSGQEHHKLLGEADGLTFVKAGEADDKRRHLLEPVPEFLGQQLWKLDFEFDPPRLLVNKDAKPGWREVARSEYFTALVYPEVFRQLLTRALFGESPWAEDDEENGWQSDWVKFAKMTGGLGEVPAPDFKEERESWIEEAVNMFSNRMEYRSVWDRAIDPEGQR